METKDYHEKYLEFQKEKQQKEKENIIEYKNLIKETNIRMKKDIFKMVIEGIIAFICIYFSIYFKCYTITIIFSILYGIILLISIVCLIIIIVMSNKMRKLIIKLEDKNEI